MEKPARLFSRKFLSMYHFSNFQFHRRLVYKYAYMTGSSLTGNSCSRIAVVMYDPSEIGKNVVSDTEHNLDVSIATYKICRELPEFVPNLSLTASAEKCRSDPSAHCGRRGTPIRQENRDKRD